MKKIPGIYMVTNPIGEVYIGSSKNVLKRLLYHKIGLCKHYPNTKIAKSYITFGIENHSFIFLDQCDDSFLLQREDYWIKYYNSIERGLNTNKVNKKFEERIYKYKGIPNIPEETIVEGNKKIVLNTQTGIYYIGYDEPAFSINSTVSTLSKRLKGHRENKTSFIICD